MPAQLLPTTVVGSYPQPEWLVDFKVLKSQTVPRVRVKEMWRVAEPFLEQAQDDATLIAIRDMERARIDIITDGEMRRENYFKRFANARDLQKAGADVMQLDEPWLRNDPEAAKRFAVKAINRALDGITVPTVVHLCFGYAFLVKDKPSSYFFLSELADSKAQQISIESAQPKIDLGVLKDLSGKKIMLGVINLGDQIVETPEQVAERIRLGLKYVSPDRLIPAPDCGMKYLSREVAFGKLKALADGAAIVRKELS